MGIVDDTPVPLPHKPARAPGLRVSAGERQNPDAILDRQSPLELP